MFISSKFDVVFSYKRKIIQPPDSHVFTHIGNLNFAAVRLGDLVFLPMTDLYKPLLPRV